MLKTLGQPNIKYAAVHHFGGVLVNRFRSTQHYVREQIELAHQSQWGEFPSRLNGSFIGYNAIVWSDGSYTQHRFVGEETAAQRGYNHNTISICLAGNFTRQGKGYIDTPTAEQIKTLQKLLEWSHEQFGVSVIKPHRWFSKTSCYGDLLSDNWALDLLVDYIQIKISLLSRIVVLLQRVLRLHRVLGAEDRECKGQIII